MTLKTKFGHELMGKFWPKVYPILWGKIAKIRPKFNKNWNMAKIAPKSDKFTKKWSWRPYLGNVWTTYKSGLRILIWPLEVPFFWSQRWALLEKSSPNMVFMTFILWIDHFWARFWPYFNFVDFRAYFGHFPIVKLGISVKYVCLI